MFVQENAENSDKEVLDQIFPLIVWPMRTLGLWPTNSVQWRRRIFVFLNIFYVHSPMVVYMIKHRDNFLQASYAICEMGGGLIYYWRLLWFGFLPHYYLGVIEDLVQGWRNANRSNIPEWMTNRTNVAKKSYRFSAFLSTYFVLATLKYLVITIGLQLYRVYILGKDERIDFASHVDFIVNVLDPFDPVGYSIIVVPMLIIVMLFIYALSLIGVFFTLIVYNTGVLFRIICININALAVRISTLNEDQILQELKAISIVHRDAINTAKKLDRALRYTMLFQLIINSFFICIIGFDIFAIQTDFTTITNFAGYGAAILFEFLLDSYVCDYLTQEASKVPDAIWNVAWYTQTPKVRRHLMLMMVHGQKTTGVVRAGISYFTLMRRMYAK